VKNVTVFTDGGCLGNPGPGGWAAILQSDGSTRELSGGEPATTNNRMELTAAISALAILNAPCEVTLFTDSQYLRQGITAWIRNWKAKGWITSTRQPVKNADLWKSLDVEYERHTITWNRVRGHTGQPENERCDVLASAEIEKIKKSHTPEELARALDQLKVSANPAQGLLF